MTIKPEEFNKVINDIQICSFMCGLGKGNLHEKQEEYLLIHLFYALQHFSSIEHFLYSPHYSY